MVWLLVLAWFVYCVPVAPTWCYVFVALRSGGRSALFSWAIAAGCAALWFTFWPVHIRHVRAAHSVGDQIASEFKSVYG